MCPMKKVPVFVSLPLFGFTLVINLRNSNFESHSNTLIFFDKKMIPDLNMSYQAVPDFFFYGNEHLHIKNKTTVTWHHDFYGCQ